ncbi:hypothetical protein [Streptomyces sp. NPDC060194]|uniref:hypothetical protein n=1 Tax=Streptomyces sp. NPDC060194 TaxID=3347069 RepID=UPI00364AEFC5
MRHRRHRWGAVLGTAALTVCAAAAPAHADSSVRDGEIRWSDATQFDDAREWAADVWYDSESGLDRVRIGAAPALVDPDLEWRDESRPDVAWVGLWRGGPGPDSVIMNTALLGDGKPFGTRGWRRMTAAHELGHALGIGHLGAGSLMAARMRVDIGGGRPTRTDRAAYHRLWG